MDFGDLHDQALSLEQQYGDMAPAPANDLPISGSATYEGTVAFSTAEEDASAILTDPEMMSLIALELDFTDSTLGGSLHSFVRADGEAVDGELGLVGSIQGNQIEAAARGELSLDGTRTSYSGGIAGQLVGDAGEAVLGSSSLVAATPSGGSLFGTFVAR